MLRLVDVQRGSEVALRCVRRDALCGSGDERDTLLQALERLQEARLVRFKEAAPDADSNPQIEPVHSALTHYWARLDDWLMRVRIEREEREARRKRRILLGAACGIAALAVAAAILGWIAAANAAQAGRLTKARELVAEARNYTDSRPDLALLLGLEAHNIDPTSTSARTTVLGLLERNLQLNAILPLPGTAGAMSVSPDGQAIGAAYRDRVVVWDSANLTQLAQMRAAVAAGGNAMIKALTFNPDHSRVAMTLVDNTVEVFDTATGQSVISWPGSLPLAGLAFRGDAQLATIGAADGVLSLRSIAAQEVPALTLRTQPIGNGATVFSADGARLAIFGCQPLQLQSCPRGHVEVRDTSAGTLVWQSADELKSRVTVAAFSPDGTRLALGQQDGSVGAWETADQSMPSLTWSAVLPQPVTSVAWSRDARLIAAGDCSVQPAVNEACPETDITLFDATGGQRLGPVITRQPGATTSLAFLPNGNLLAAARGSAVAIWDPAAVQQLPTRSISQASVTAPLPNGRLAESTCVAWDREICIGTRIDIDDASSGQPVATWQLNGVAIQSLTASPDGQRLAAGGDDGVIRLWNPEAADQPPTTLPLPTDPAGASQPHSVLAVALGSGGALAASDETGEVLLWKSLGGLPLRLPARGTAPMSRLAFDPAQQQLAAGSQDGSVVFFDVARAAAMRAPQAAHTGPITNLVFSPDGTLLASGSTDRTLVVWDAPSGSQLGLPLQVGNLRSVAFDDKGRLTSSDGSLLTIWGMSFPRWPDVQSRACQLAHRSLSRGEWTAFQISDSYTPICGTYSATSD